KMLFASLLKHLSVTVTLRRSARSAEPRRATARAVPLARLPHQFDRSSFEARPAAERLRMTGLAWFSLHITAALLLPCSPASAEPADYPNRVIHIVVPSPAGGPPDQIARMVATRLGAAFNQSVIVENRPGAGGMVGTAHVAKTPPDGYTVLITTASHTLIPAFTPNTPYDAVKDFTPVTLLAENYGQVLLGRPSLPGTSVQQLVALARAQPGKLSYGQAGLGTASHIPAEVMLGAADIDMLEVPYKGTSAAMTDLLAGQIDMFFIGPQI